MDKFRTTVEIPAPGISMEYTDKSLWVGSCFAGTIGQMMKDYKFPVIVNPFGTLFNPLSVAGNLLRLISRKEYDTNDLFNYQHTWFSFDHYTGFSNPDRDACLRAVNTAFNAASAWLRHSKFLLLTFGTAVTFKQKKTGKVVANCHKMPSSEFNRHMAEPDEIIDLFNETIDQLRKVNPGIHIVFTVSPVRHWSDGAVSNQLSKSVLHYAIHRILKTHSNTSYFPAYEIFMDELRDYRFYASDLLHPSDSGTDYIWERFTDTYVDKASGKIMTGVSAILKAAGHRPFNTETTNHKKFVERTLLQISQLTSSYPFLDFSKEIAALQL